MNYRSLLVMLGLVLSLSTLSTPAHAVEIPAAEQQDKTKAGTRAKRHVDLGQAYLGAGRLAVALEEADRALAADANHAPAFNLLGLVHMFLNEPKEAEENFRRALSIAPNDPEFSNNYGWLLCQEGREAESFSYFMTAVKNPLYQTPSRPYYNAGLCALRLKDTKKAEDYFQRALSMDPRNAQALYQLAELRYKAGQYFDAQRMVSDLLLLAPEDPAPIWLALRVERRLGNREEELNYAKQLRSKFASSPQNQAMSQGKFE